MNRVLIVNVILSLYYATLQADELNQSDTLIQKTECRDFSQVGFKDRSVYLKYLSNLKSAQTVVEFEKLVVFPLRVNRSPKKHMIISDTATFRNKFKEVFTDQVLRAIQKAEANDNFCNYQGMSIGNGTLWIDKKGDRTGIFVINQKSKPKFKVCTCLIEGPQGCLDCTCGPGKCFQKIKTH